MAKNKQQSEVSDTLTTAVAVANGEPPLTQEGATNGTPAATKKARKKQKGPRTVFYMACTVNPESGRCTEVTRAETRNQLDKKMLVIREAFGTSYEDLTYLQCRSL